MPPWLARLLGLGEGNGLKSSIAEVLSRGPQGTVSTNEIAPHLLGGQANPVQLPTVTAVGRGASLSPEEISHLMTGSPRTTKELEAYFMSRLGVLPSQRREDWSEERARAIFDSTSPIGSSYYSSSPSELLQEARRRISSRESNRQPNPMQKASEDAWAMYLGLPQPFHSWEVSPFKPTRASNTDETYYRLPSIWDALNASPSITDVVRTAEKKANTPEETVRALLELIGRGDRTVIQGDRLNPQPFTTEPAALANFTVGRGEDERGPYLSIYDIWDLDRIPGADKVGVPFEVYDRLYYDPRTYSPRQP